MIQLFWNKHGALNYSKIYNYTNLLLEMDMDEYYIYRSNIARIYRE